MADTHDGLWRSVATEGGPRSACASIAERLLSLPEFRSIHYEFGVWSVALAGDSWPMIYHEAATLDDAAAGAMDALARSRVVE